MSDLPDTHSPCDPDVTALRRKDDAVDLDIRVAAEHPYFQGHFPGVPILAGAAQIDWAVRLADRFLNAGIGAARRFQVKFRRPIRPGRTVTLALRLSREKRQLSFDFRGEDGAYSTGRITLQDER